MSNYRTVTKGLKDIIDKIIEIDNRAKVRVEQLKNAGIRRQNEILAEQEIIREELEKRSEKRVAIIYETEKEYANKKLQAILEEKENVLKRLNTKEKSNFDDWVSDVVKNVIE